MRKRCPTEVRVWLAIGLCACSPMTMGGDDSAPDLAPRPADMANCAAPGGNLLRNPSFEAGGGAAFNTGAPRSSIEGWDGCCNLDGQGETTRWHVEADAARCGGRGVVVRSSAARGDVLNQDLTISDGAGRSYDLTGWVLLREADPGAQILLDLFDTAGKRVVQASPPLVTAGATWSELSVSGQLPQGGAPHVQVRIYSKGTLTASVDDLALVLR